MNKTERPKADGAGEEDGMAPASVVMKGNAAMLNSFTDTDRSAPISRDRRRVLGGIAASCAGLAGAAIASSNPLPPSPVAAHPALHEPEVSCGRSKVAASDEATVVETSAGKDPGIQAKRDLYLQGCSLRRIDFRCKPLHASIETRALERNSQHPAVWSSLSQPGFRSRQHRWKESRDYG
jgi:hypothetical protein